MVRFHKHRDGVETTFVKGPREEVVTISYTEEDGLSTKQTTKYDELFQKIKYATKSCNNVTGDEYLACVARDVIDDVSKLTAAKEYLDNSRGLIASRLRNYTCADPKLNFTVPSTTSKYVSNLKVEHEVGTLLDDAHAKIWTVDNFITEEECRILHDHAAPRLHSATVAAHDGSSVVSENRKAQQAGYSLRKDRKNDPLWSVPACAIATFCCGLVLEWIKG